LRDSRRRSLRRADERGKLKRKESKIEKAHCPKHEKT